MAIGQCNCLRRSFSDGVTCGADLEEVAQLQPASMLQVMLPPQCVVHILQAKMSAAHVMLQAAEQQGHFATGHACAAGQ